MTTARNPFPILPCYVLILCKAGRSTRVGPLDQTSPRLHHWPVKSPSLSLATSSMHDWVVAGPYRTTAYPRPYVDASHPLLISHSPRLPSPRPHPPGHVCSCSRPRRPHDQTRPSPSPPAFSSRLPPLPASDASPSCSSWPSSYCKDRLAASAWTAPLNAASWTLHPL